MTVALQKCILVFAINNTTVNKLHLSHWPAFMFWFTLGENIWEWCQAIPPAFVSFLQWQPVTTRMQNYSYITLWHHWHMKMATTTICWLMLYCAASWQIPTHKTMEPRTHPLHPKDNSKASSVQASTATHIFPSLTRKMQYHLLILNQTHCFHF